MQIQPYVFFDGRCEEAIAFYTSALGATLEMMMRYSESPDPLPPGMLQPGMENKVMHSTLRIGESVMHASDGHCLGKAVFEGFSLSLNVASEAEADKTFTALSDGGTVQMPIAKTFFSPRFGMVQDRFGVVWMVIVPT